jgi:hypothetical protein
VAIELLVQIDWVSGTERYSLQGIAAKSAFYEPRVISFGTSQREIPPVPGDFSASTMTVVLDNSDNYFGKKRAFTPFFSAQVHFLLGDMSLGESDFTEIFVGTITTHRLTPLHCELNTGDIGLRLADSKLLYRINEDTFPQIPDTTLRHMVPIILGEVSSVGFSNAGALPGYLVDAASAQPKYRYLAGLGVLKSVIHVYTYGVLDDPSTYTVSQVSIANQIYTVIDFVADQRDPTRKNDIEVTFDAIGLTDDGTTAGNSISNPSDQLKKVLLLNGIATSDIDTASFATAVTNLNILKITGGVAIIGDSVTIRQMLVNFADSFNIQFFPSRGGKIAITVPQTDGGSTVGLVRIVDAQHVLRDSLEIVSPENVATTIAVNYGQNWATGKFEGSDTVTDLVQQARQGARTIIATANLWFARTPGNANIVGQQKLFYMREERQVIRVAIDAALLKLIDIGQEILFTHFCGVSADGTYADKTFRIIGIGIDGSNGLLMARIKMVDLDPTPANSDKAFADYGVPYLPFHSNQYANYDDQYQPSEEPMYSNERGFGGI